MTERELFPELEFTSLLDVYAQQGFVFLTVPQIAKALDLGYQQIINAIESYRLDAFLIGGKYRATIASVREYQENSWEEFEKSAMAALRAAELDGVYELALGSEISAAVDSLASHSYPITAVDDLLAKTRTWHYNELPEGHTEARDYYDIPSLNLPEKLSVAEIADLLQVDATRNPVFKNLQKSLEWTYPELFDFLTEHELVNVTDPFKTRIAQSFPKPDGQLELF